MSASTVARMPNARIVVVGGVAQGMVSANTVMVVAVLGAIAAPSQGKFSSMQNPSFIIHHTPGYEV
jgi:hypothetical protein